MTPDDENCIAMCIMYVVFLGLIYFMSLMFISEDNKSRTDNVLYLTSAADVTELVFKSLVYFVTKTNTPLPQEVTNFIVCKAFVVGFFFVFYFAADAANSDEVKAFFSGAKHFSINTISAVYNVLLIYQGSLFRFSPYYSFIQIVGILVELLHVAKYIKTLKAPKSKTE